MKSIKSILAAALISAVMTGLPVIGNVSAQDAETWSLRGAIALEDAAPLADVKNALVLHTMPRASGPGSGLGAQQIQERF